MEAISKADGEAQKGVGEVLDTGKSHYQVLNCRVEGPEVSGDQRSYRYKSQPAETKSHSKEEDYK